MSTFHATTTPVSPRASLSSSTRWRPNLESPVGWPRSPIANPTFRWQDERDAGDAVAEMDKRDVDGREAPLHPPVARAGSLHCSSPFSRRREGASRSRRGEAQNIGRNAPTRWGWPWGSPRREIAPVDVGAARWLSALVFRITVTAAETTGGAMTTAETTTAATTGVTTGAMTTGAS